VKAVIAALLIVFSLAEVLPVLKNIQFSGNHLIVGGLLSGFFGGLTGIQGALRNAFLIKCGISKESFIATDVVIACLVDISRLSVYASRIASVDISGHYGMMAPAILSAIAGAYVGNRLLKNDLPDDSDHRNNFIAVVCYRLGRGSYLKGIKHKALQHDMNGDRYR
jgi:hypothetical protein